VQRVSFLSFARFLFCLLLRLRCGHKFLLCGSTYLSFATESSAACAVGFAAFPPHLCFGARLCFGLWSPASSKPLSPVRHRSDSDGSRGPETSSTQLGAAPYGTLHAGKLLNLVGLIGEQFCFRNCLFMALMLCSALLFFFATNIFGVHQHRVKLAASHFFGFNSFN